MHSLPAASVWPVTKLVCLLTFTMLTAISCQHAPPPSHAAEWRSIFDGRSTSGWEMVGPGELKVENGELVTHGGMGMLWYSRAQLGHCQIRVVFQLTGEKDNSGVFIRIPERPLTPWDAVNQGYEVQIDNTGDEWHHTGCLYSLTRARNLVNAGVGNWNTMLITLDGRRTIVEVNGQIVTDYMEGDPVPEKKNWYEPERGPRPELGYIGVQNHDDHTKVHFKEVSVRPLR